MLKGGGSDNASALAMLPPSAGLDGVLDFVIRAVEAKATGACPPLLVGVAVGGTFDTVAGLAKRALLRRIGTPAGSAAAAGAERRMLEAINATGIGPAGLGGRTTALAVHLVTAACHIAALPVAVNMGCCAVRSAVVEVA
jgi:tartrate/fumarate subfamily iron-sulfur-dependent hydro-lyase alpha chain